MMVSACLECLPEQAIYILWPHVLQILPFPVWELKVPVQLALSTYFFLLRGEYHSNVGSDVHFLLVECSLLQP